jgi:hypothetical protein
MDRDAARDRPGRSSLTRARIALAWLLAAAATLFVLIFGASRAGGGIYRVAQCHAGLGAAHPDLSFTRSSEHYRADAGCGPGGGGLAVTHAARSTAGGHWGSWSLSVPASTELLHARMVARGRSRDGHVPQLAVAPGSSATSPATRRFARPGGDWRKFAWDGPATKLAGTLRCARARCGPGGAAEVAVRRIVLVLRDVRQPRLRVAGALAGQETVRGPQPLELSAADAGSGVRRASLEVNGRPVASRELGCELARGIALRLRPCAAAATTTFTARTGEAPFRQGMNSIRACALDYAAQADAGSACEAKRVRVDNDCPLDGSSREGRLRAHAIIRPGRRPVIAGRLIGDAGVPLADAVVCVATTTRIPGAPERVAATPTTDAQGRFRVALRPRPSRRVRVAYWRDSTHVEERFLAVRVAARPRFRAAPARTLHNGERAHFRAALPGPGAGHRLVRLEARAAGRWVLVRSGRTDRRGRWRASYRFHATTGSRTYRFRVAVPPQAGYPYRRGHSRVRAVRVSGDGAR